MLLVQTLLCSCETTWEGGVRRSTPLPVHPPRIRMAGGRYVSGRRYPQPIHPHASAWNFFGTISTNPYVFKHFKLNHLALRVNNVVTTNSELTPDFEKHLYAREYSRLFTQTGKRGSTSQGVLISEKDFANNHTLFPFDLTPDECNSRHLHLGKQAKLDVEMRWAEALEDPIIVLVMATFDQVMHIDNGTGKVKISLI